MPRPHREHLEEPTTTMAVYYSDYRAFKELIGTQPCADAFRDLLKFHNLHAEPTAPVKED